MCKSVTRGLPEVWEDQPRERERGDDDGDGDGEILPDGGRQVAHFVRTVPWERDNYLSISVGIYNPLEVVISNILN